MGSGAIFFIYIYIYIYIYTYTHTHTHTYIYIYTHIHILHICMCVCIYIYIYIYMCVCVCVCVCVYIYIKYGTWPHQMGNKPLFKNFEQTCNLSTVQWLTCHFFLNVELCIMDLYYKLTFCLFIFFSPQAEKTGRYVHQPRPREKAWHHLRIWHRQTHACLADRKLSLLPDSSCFYF